VFRLIYLCVSALALVGFAGNAFGSAALPHVNSARTISAREAFGVAPSPRHRIHQDSGGQTAPIQVAESRPQSTNNEPQVVARAAAQPVTVPHPAPLTARNAPRNTGGGDDVLAPRRPNDNLWARGASVAQNDTPAAARSIDQRTFVARTAAVPVALPVPVPAIAPYPSAGRSMSHGEMPLRMPSPEEFSLVDDNFGLPPENLFAMNTPSAPPPAAVPREEPIIFSAPVSTIQNRAIIPPPPPAAPVPEDVIVRRMEVSFNDMPREAVPAPQNIGRDGLFARAAAPIAEPIAAPPSPPAARAAADIPLNRLSPTQLRRAFQKTYVSENRHLSTYRIDDRFDVASEITTEMQGFESLRDLSEEGGIRPLEIRIGFRGNDASLSRDNFQLLSEYAGLVVANPRRAIQISIPEGSTRSFEDRRIAARRLAIVEQVLRDSGISDNRIMPVLTPRDGDAFVLRVISSDVFQTLVERQRDMFGDTVQTRTSRSLAW